MEKITDKEEMLQKLNVNILSLERKVKTIEPH
jgi:hypothetical protein